MVSGPPRKSLLSPESWGILIIHMVWFVALVHEMINFWAMRKKMRIHARSPMLALLSGAASMQTHIVVMLQEIFAQEGSLFPCWIVLYTNAVAVAFYAVPYLLRGIRVVIISDKEWRTKYSMMLSRQNIIIFISAVFVVLLGICTWLMLLSPQVYGPNPTAKCFILGDWWFFGPTAGLLAAVSSKLFIELARVQDRIHMSKEISSAALSWLLTAMPFFSLIVLDYYKLVDTPRQNNFLLSLCMVLTNISTFFVEPRRHKGSLTCGKRKRIAVVIDEPHVAKWREEWHNSKVIMAYPPLDEAFEKHVQDYLCSESYDFLKTVERYVRTVPTLTAEECFMKFREIVDTYILAGSELEVNIETAMRNKILKIGEKDQFLAEGAEIRKHIFNASSVEIRKMLDENLLKTFLVSTVFLNACKRIEEEAEMSASTEIRHKRSTLLALGDGNLDDEMSMAQAVVQMERRAGSFKRVGSIKRTASLS